MTHDDATAPAPHADPEPQDLPLCKFARLGQCTRPVKPTPPGSRGRRHEYCDTSGHNPVTFNRARTAAVRAGEYDAPAGVATAGLVSARGGHADARPVTAARIGFEASGVSAAATLRQLGAQVDLWLERAEAITDPENVETQIRAVTLDAAARITAAQQVAAAETARRAEAERAGQVASALAEQCVADARVAQDALDSAVAQHERLVQGERADAAARLDLVRGEADARVHAVEEAARGRVEDAGRALAEAVAEAVRAREGAERREAAAGQRVAMVEEAAAARIEAAGQKAELRVQTVAIEAAAAAARADALVWNAQRVLADSERTAAAERAAAAARALELGAAGDRAVARADQEGEARREAAERANRSEARCDGLRARLDELTARWDTAAAALVGEREVRAGLEVEVARLRPGAQGGTGSTDDSDPSRPAPLP